MISTDTCLRLRVSLPDMRATSIIGISEYAFMAHKLLTVGMNVIGWCLSIIHACTAALIEYCCLVDYGINAN